MGKNTHEYSFSDLYLLPKGIIDLLKKTGDYYLLYKTNAIITLQTPMKPGSGDLVGVGRGVWVGVLCVSFRTGVCVIIGVWVSLTVGVLFSPPVTLKESSPMNPSLSDRLT